jgi:hypothetical protein
VRGESLTVVVLVGDRFTVLPVFALQNHQRKDGAPSNFVDVGLVFCFRGNFTYLTVCWFEFISLNTSSKLFKKDR